MRLSEWANIAEVTGAIAVVASLVYVGIQINQNTSVVQAEVDLRLVDETFGSLGMDTIRRLQSISELTKNFGETTDRPTRRSS